VRKTFVIKHSTDEINWNKLASSIAPNIVHSFDSSHLILTTNRCLSEGIDEFAFVHDSFATYPDKTEELLNCTKEAWIDMYSVNHLQRLYEEWCLIYPMCDIPHYTDYISMGDLNIEDVTGSDFFFA